ncbi:MAG: hypothetical protein EBU08_05620 [Micrococcales bacterium]|nr:hypothetical protein [Micrococcales bacterium]
MPILGTQSSRSGGTPTAPTSVSATAGDASATVTFTASSYIGKGSVTYTAISSPGNITATGTSPITVTGLTNGTAYTFTVRATSSTGETATSSASLSTTPVAPDFMARLSYTYDMTSININTDSSGNIYTVGHRYGSDSSQKYGYVTKHSADGALIWQKQIAHYASGPNRRTNSSKAVWVDSSLNVYIAATEMPINENYNYNHSLITKLDSSGNLVWQKLYNGPTDGGGTPQQFNLYSLDADSSNNLYFSGGMTDTGTQDQDYCLTKISSAGTHAWTYYYAFSGDQGSGNYFTAMDTDSSGNSHCIGHYPTQTLISKGNYVYHSTWNTVKINNSGTITWARKFYDYSKNHYVYDVAIDSSENVHSIGSSNQNGTYQFHVAKHNSSGSLQWQRRIYDASSSAAGYRLAVDSSGNVYGVGGESNTSPYAVMIIKWDSSGTVQWQRRFIASSQSPSVNDVTVSGTSLIITGNYTNGSINNAYLIKVPLDGSKTGTYTVGGLSYVYSTASYTETSGSMTDASESLTQSSARSITTNTGDSTIEAGLLSVATTSI